jgi:hypothetical protein
MKRKWLAVGITLLFVAIAFSPATNARNDALLPKAVSNSENDVSITVLEYKPDGTIEKSIVKMSQEQTEKFKGELNGVKDLDTRLSIYKKYHFIPQDATAEKLRLGMEEKAQRIGLTQEKLDQIVSTDSLNLENTLNLLKFRLTYINFKCSICGDGFFLIIPFGTASLKILPYYLFKKNITCHDIHDTIIGFAGTFNISGGLLPNREIEMEEGVLKLIGFVGYMSWIYVNTPWVKYYYSSFEGYSVYIRAFFIPSFS